MAILFRFSEREFRTSLEGPVALEGTGVDSLATRRQELRRFFDQAEDRSSLLKPRHGAVRAP